jgi:hypothetical protein
MALAFPISASIGQTYQSGSSNTYEWTGTYWKIKNVVSYNFVNTASFNEFSASVSDRIVTATNEGQFATTGSNQFYGDQILSGTLYFNDDYNSTQAAMGMFQELSGSGIPLLDNISKDFVILSPTSDITLVTLLNNASTSSNDVAQVSLTRSGSLDVYANMMVSGSIIPATANGTYTSSFSLGSATNAWKDLYISHGSIIFVDAQTQETSSFSIENNAGGQNTVKYTAAVTASAYLGDGRQLTNLSANTNWNNTYDSYLIRNTEQLTFSGDYILENAFLLIEGSEPNSIGEWTNVNVEGNGTMTRTGNNTYRIDGPNYLNSENSGWLFIKRYFDTATTMSIDYVWSNSDEESEDWPMYDVLSEEPTGEISNTNRLDDNNALYETGSWTINVPANNWLAIGVWSTDSCCGSGSLNITLPYILNEDVQYAPNKYFKKEGSIFIGGNLLLKDSVIENNGKISVGGEVILIGNSSIEGTGTII